MPLTPAALTLFVHPYWDASCARTVSCLPPPVFGLASSPEERELLANPSAEGGVSPKTGGNKTHNAIGRMRGLQRSPSNRTPTNGRRSATVYAHKYRASSSQSAHGERGALRADRPAAEARRAADHPNTFSPSSRHPS
ncbi:hypothetical protein SRHO_G00105920 [Serrasalmus rhombeus]